MKNNFKPIVFAVVVSILLLFGVLAGKNYLRKAEKINPEITPPVESGETPAVLPEAESDDLIESFNNSEKVPYEYTLSTGEEVTIEIPKGIDPPPQAVVEKLKALEDKEKKGN